MRRHFYFAKEIAHSDRSMIAAYNLPDRVYIGPTSMDTEMAFLMCNMAKVNANLAGNSIKYRTKTPKHHKRNK